MEDFINHVLGDNAVRAGQRLPPLTFKEIEERVKDVIDRKWKYAKIQNRNLPSRNNFQNDNNNNNRKIGPPQQQQQQNKMLYNRLLTFLHAQKNVDDICVWFNLKEGCHAKGYNKKHICSKLPFSQKDLCKENYSMVVCKKK